MILCGRPKIDSIGQVIDNERILTEYADFFGKEVDIFFAENDPSFTVLYKSSDVASYLGCPGNKVIVLVNTLSIIVLTFM